MKSTSKILPKRYSEKHRYIGITNYLTCHSDSFKLCPIRGSINPTVRPPSTQRERSRELVKRRGSFSSVENSGRLIKRSRWSVAARFEPGGSHAAICRRKNGTEAGRRLKGNRNKGEKNSDGKRERERERDREEGKEQSE